MATTNKRTIQLRCAACGGTLEVEEDSQILTCPYCGAKELIVESDDVKIERIRAKAKKEVELEKLKYNKEKKEKQEEEDRIAKFRRSLMRKFLIVCLVVFFICTIMAFTTGGSPLAGVIGLVQTGLVGAALLLGNGTIKTRIPNMRQVFQTVALLLIIVFLLAFGMNGGVDHNEKLVWPSDGLSAKLPVPDSEYGHIYRDNSEVFDCSVYHYSEELYGNYRKACRDLGFEAGESDGNWGWTAFNSEGDKLELYYYDSDKEMSVTLTAAIPMSDLRWPTSRLGRMVPAPGSQVGHVEWEADYGFVIYVGNTTRTEYDEYVAKCIDAGFDVNYSRNDGYYYADNKDGFHLSVTYYGNDIMVVRADQPYDYEEEGEEEEVVEQPSEEPAQEEPETQEDPEEDGEVSAEFRAAMDEYEAFIDDYITFMNKYNSAEDKTAMAEDYTGFIDKFTNIMNSLNTIDPGSLSQADYNYYQQVLTRIFMKLAVLGI